ncbi:MAG: hypothetical protein JW937_07600, partial [Candidatus Omnitrophica bacterium]|nr:hypothetical protein [Candidatus Omnitrophota bacterium]
VFSEIAKIRLREREYEMAKVRAGLNEALTSEVLTNMTRLADQRALFLDALQEYYESLSGLNRVTGYALFP